MQVDFSERSFIAAMQVGTFIILLIVFSGCFTGAYAQSTPAKPAEKVYHVAEQMPEFAGGEDSLMRYLEKQISYPKEAIRQNQEGTVQQAFIIDANGNVVIPPRIPAKPGSIDAEVLRVLKSMPKWKPGRQNGVPVSVGFVLPVHFRLPAGTPGSQPSIEVNKPFGYTEELPRFPGGEVAMAKFLEKNLKYPRKAYNARIEGVSVISFVVNTDGTLSDLKVLKALGYGLDEEAIRVIQAMPLWEPGKQNDKAVTVRYALPVRFP